MPSIRNLTGFLIFGHKKTCTATTFPRTIRTSSYLARNFITFPHELLPDTYFVVYGVFFLETVQTALSLADLYYWFAVGFGNVFQLTMPFASFVDVPIMGSVVSLSVQFFFVYRILLLSEKQSWWLCVVICLVTSSPEVSGRPYHFPCSFPLSVQ